MKLTAVPTAVAAQPTVVAISSRTVTASRVPAAVSAGMPRKNDSRVAVTRSMPRSRPAEIVAPDRDTPGTRAKHWTSPMMRPSKSRTSRSPRCWVARCSAKTITADHTISPAATTQRLRSGPSMTLLAARPTTAIGMRADDDRGRQAPVRRPAGPPALNSPRTNGETIRTISRQK